MKKTSKSFSITLILAIMLLACLLLNSLGYVGSWFTVTGKPVEIILNVVAPEDLVKVYQTQNGEDVALNYAEGSYIQLDGKIEPDVQVPINLKVKTSDTYGFYIKFKFEVRANGVTDTVIDTEDTIVAPTESTNGFVVNDENYYVYQDNTTASQKFVSSDGKETSLDLVTQFKIKLSEFENNNFNGETIKIVLTVICSEIA